MRVPTVALSTFVWAHRAHTEFSKKKTHKIWAHFFCNFKITKPYDTSNTSGWQRRKRIGFKEDKPFDRDAVFTFTKSSDRIVALFHFYLNSFFFFFLFFRLFSGLRFELTANYQALAPLADAHSVCNVWPFDIAVTNKVNATAINAIDISCSVAVIDATQWEQNSNNNRSPSLSQLSHIGSNSNWFRSTWSRSYGRLCVLVCVCEVCAFRAELLRYSRRRWKSIYKKIKIWKKL